MKEDLQVLETQLTKLCAEANYLHDRLTAIVSFNASSVDRDNISELESRLKDMRIDYRGCDTYFIAELTKNEMSIVNSEIDSLLVNVGKLFSGKIGLSGKSRF